MAECLQCGRPGGGGKRVVPRLEEGRCPGCGEGIGFPGAPLEQNAGAEKSPVTQVVG